MINMDANTGLSLMFKGSGSGGSGSNDNKNKPDIFSTIGKSFINSTGDIGNYVNAAMQGASNGGGAYGAILSAIAQLLSDVMQIVSENSERFQVFQNLVTLLLETFVQQIVPIFDELVTPFLEGFSAVKELLSGIIYLIGGC